MQRKKLKAQFKMFESLWWNEIFLRVFWKLVWSKFSCWRSIWEICRPATFNSWSACCHCWKNFVFVKNNLGNLGNWIGRLLEGQLKKTGFCLLWRRVVLFVMLTRRCCLLPKWQCSLTICMGGVVSIILC